MLPAKYRLHAKKDTSLVFEQGKTILAGSFLLKYLKNNKDNNRFCFIVTKKISKRAVDRNRLKRQLREIVRLNLDKIKKNYDIIILPNPKILGSEFDYLASNLLLALSKIN